MGAQLFERFGESGWGRVGDQPLPACADLFGRGENAGDQLGDAVRIERRMRRAQQMRQAAPVGFGCRRCGHRALRSIAGRILTRVPMPDEVCCGAATVSPNAWYAQGLCMAGMRLFRWFGGAAIPIFAVHHSGGEEFVMSLINLFVGARNAWKGWRERQRAYDELMALDDYALADIGIRRSEIPAIVEGLHEKTRDESVGARQPAIGLSSRQVKLALGGRWLPPV
jgi:uncharacterized protein YjiS (DUF1127 family)